MTVRGWRIISSASSWSSLATGCRKNSVEVLLERQVDHGLGRCCAALARDLGHRAVRAVHGVEHEEPVVVGRPRLGADAARPSRSRRGLDQPAAQLGVAQLPLLLVERQRADLLPLRQAVERQLGLERQQRAERAAVRLGEHAPARRGGLVEQRRGTCARRPGDAAPAEHAERDRPPGLHGEVAQPRVVLAQRRDRRRRGPTSSPASSKMPALSSPMTPTSRRTSSQLASAAGHRAAVGRLVARRARGGEADGAGAERVAQLALHRAQIVLGRPAPSNARSPIA